MLASQPDTCGTTRHLDFQLARPKRISDNTTWLIFPVWRGVWVSSKFGQAGKHLGDIADEDHDE